jgi:hypothetical protein
MTLQLKRNKSKDEGGSHGVGELHIRQNLQRQKDKSRKQFDMLDSNMSVSRMNFFPSATEEFQDGDATFKKFIMEGPPPDHESKGISMNDLAPEYKNAYQLSLTRPFFHKLGDMRNHHLEHLAPGTVLTTPLGKPKYAGQQANELSKWMNAEGTTRTKEETNAAMPTIRQVLRIDDTVGVDQMTKRGGGLPGDFNADLDKRPKPDKNAKLRHFKSYRP